MKDRICGCINDEICTSCYRDMYNLLERKLKMAVEQRNGLIKSYYPEVLNAVMIKNFDKELEELK